MKFFGMGMAELIVILVIVALIFGPRNLPKLGHAIGKTISSFRSGLKAGRGKESGGAASEAHGSGIEDDGDEAGADDGFVAFEDQEDDSEGAVAEIAGGMEGKQLGSGAAVKAAAGAR